LHQIKLTKSNPIRGLMLMLMLELIGLPNAGVESSQAAAFAAVKHGSLARH
jgi:hypothetical protein